ncbi:hypothetical protein QQ008_18925 [Fulvivirgaceae bacterium BMA10]|uniref:Lipocalin-like domain-containing protein n=1 Tax=Splendidivirga corallicola TaxID=3051826 RepID=A0ABT8KTH1_9BACT|nr:hypothetical protein [Fulvivirgaceae bacterium BMA10]
MRTVKLFVLVIAVLCIHVSLASALMQQKPEKFLGTWEVKSAEAPYEYSRSTVKIFKKGNKLEGTISFTNTSTYSLKDVKIDKNKLVFKLDLEGEIIQVEALNEKGTLVGSALSSQGTTRFTGTRKK